MEFYTNTEDPTDVFEEEDLDFDIEDKNNTDYWTRLEHSYAGMAMQGLSEKYFKEYRDYCAGFGDMDEDEAKGAMIALGICVIGAVIITSIAYTIWKINHDD